MSLKSLSAAFSPKQISLLTEPLADMNIVWGSSGSGKSHTANVRVFSFLSGSAPNGSLAIFTGKSQDTLYDNVVKPMIDLDQGLGKVRYVSRNGQQRLEFDRGIEAVCIGADTIDAAGRFLGKPQVCIWYGDEATMYPRNVFDMAYGRCKMVVKGKMVTSPALLTFNANHPSHFLKTEYLDKPRDDMKTWMFSLEDNPTATPEFIEKQKSRYSGLYYARMIENKWAISEGAVYETFNRGEHVINEIPISKIKRWVLGIDWGYEHPLAIALVGMDGDGIYYLADEIYARHQLLDTSLKELVKRKWGHFQIETAYCDPARPDYIRMFQDITGIQTRAANNDVHEGIQSVHRALRKRGDGSFGLCVSSGCINAITEFETYSWLSGKTGAKDEPQKTNDHMMDALRYIIHSYSKISDIHDALKKHRVRLI